MLSPSISFVIPSRSSKGTGFFYGVITTEIESGSCLSHSERRVGQRPIKPALALHRCGVSLAAMDLGLTPSTKASGKHASHKACADRGETPP
jgi:hypothetical protein